MSFKVCTWKSEPTHHVEYSPLKTGNKFVTLRTETKIVREPVLAGKHKGKYRNREIQKDLLDVKYPGYSITPETKLARDREMYWLVVNHTDKWAKTCEKTRFKEFYSEGRASQKPKGDKGVMPSNLAYNPEEDKRQAGKNKERAKRNKG